MFAALNSFQVGGSTPTFVSDVFSTTLYAGNSSTQTITNGIDLSTKGGLVWMKGRTGTQNHYLYDTVRGTNSAIFSDLTIAAQAYNYVDSFNTTGFTLNNNATNTTGNTYVSWTFREQSRFFDVVKFTTNGTPLPTISHNLGSEPGLILLKRLDSVSGWAVYHRSIGKDGFLRLDSTDAVALSANYWGSSEPTSTTFTSPFFSTGDYVAYLFAHNAGGFGGYGADNAVSCGSYTGSSGSGQSINIGYKPQWLLVKNTSRAGQNWVLMDKYRNFDNTGYGWLYPNSTASEDSATGTVYVYPTSTGFTTVTSNAATDYLTDSYIYIAIKDNS